MNCMKSNELIHIRLWVYEGWYISLTAVDVDQAYCGKRWKSESSFLWSLKKLADCASHELGIPQLTYWIAPSLVSIKAKNCVTSHTNCKPWDLLITNIDRIIVCTCWRLWKWEIFVLYLFSIMRQFKWASADMAKFQY